jgi:hypothetical protein
MRRSLLTVVLILCAVFIVQAKSQRTARNSIYAEGLGPGLLYSFNYERLVTNDLGVRLGLSYASMSASATDGSSSATASATFMTFPFTASYLGVSSGSHALELGGGLTFIYVSGTVSSSNIAVSGSGILPLENILVGYRFHPVNGGFQLRIGFSGLLGMGIGASNSNTTTTANKKNTFGFLPWFYLSLGGCF